MSPLPAVFCSQTVWPELHEGPKHMRAMAYSQLIQSCLHNYLHHKPNPCLLCSYHLFLCVCVCVSILHILIYSPSHSSLMSTDFNESDRCKQYGGNLSYPLVQCQCQTAFLEENRLLASIGFLSENFRNYTFGFLSRQDYLDV